MSVPRAAVALAAALLALAGCTSAAGSGGAAGSGTSTAAGSGTNVAARGTDVTAVQSTLTPCPPQPDRPAAAGRLPAVSLSCIGGGTLDLARAQGTPTVLNLWASWCGPCREELPYVQQVAAAAGDRLRVLGVVSRDGVGQATSFAADAGTTFPGAYDLDGQVMGSLHLVGLPATLFLAPDGSVAYTKVGPVASADELRALVAQHLGVQL